MGTVSVSLPVDGSVASVAQYDTPINTIVNEINGGLDNSNIAVSAGIDPAKLAGGSSAMLSAWASWTPTWTNLTVGSGVVEAKYCQIGKIVVARLSFIYGSGSAVGTAVSFTLPVTAVSYPNIVNDMDIIGSGHMLDSGSGNYKATVCAASITTARIYADKADATYLYTTDLTSAVPFTWAANDSITLLLTYEAA